MGFPQRQNRPPPVLPAAASNDVTVALTGVSATSAIGALGVALAIAVSGVAAAGSAGTLAPSRTVPLSGVSSTASVGTLAPSRTVPLTGVGGTGSLGTLAPSRTIGITGVAASGSIGSVGSTGGDSADVTVALTGVSSTTSVGSLVPSRTIPLTGVASGGAVGTLAPSTSRALTGVAGSGNAGSLTPSRTIPLTGVAATSAVGTMTETHDGTVQLTGVSAIGAVGTLTVAGSATAAEAPVYVLVEAADIYVVVPGGVALNETTYDERVLADGPVAYFRLDETSGTTAADSSPSALIGTISGGVTLAQPGALRYDHGAALFNGSTGRITVPNGSYAALGTGPASVELWCRIGALPVASAFLFDTKVAGSNGAGLAVNIGPTGVLVFRAGNGSAQFNVTTLAATYHDGQWHHVVGVYTRGVNDVASIYIDGALVNAQTAPAAGWNLTSAFGLGLGMYVTDIAPSANAFTGSLDEVALYQVALTAIQVAEHYRLGRMAFPDAYVVVPAS